MTTTTSTLGMADVTVADIVLNFPLAAEILTKYNLDYCCGGKKPFITACGTAGLDAALIWEEIQQARANQGADGRIRFDTWTPSLLIDFIVQHHHNFVRESIPQIQELLDRVCEAHGNDSPAVLTVRDNFNSLAEELLDHLPKEEEIVFPAIRRLLDPKSPAAAFTPLAHDILTPVTVLEHEHENAGHLIKSIRSLTDHYTVPEYACPTFRLTYSLLKEFDDDLIQHIHLENNILFAQIKK